MRAPGRICNSEYSRLHHFFRHASCSSEVCDTFTVLLDRDRTVYKAYHLERSRLRSWHPRVVWIYIKRWFRQGKFYDSHGDDTSQLGGDFIVDRQGVLRLVHPSHDPSDRPSVEELLRVLKEIEHGSSH